MPTESIGGLAWIADAQVTTDASQDIAPQLTVFADSTSKLLWQSDRSGTFGYYTAALSKTGDVADPDAFVTNRTPAASALGVAQGSPVAVDSQRNIHMVFEYDWTNTGYAKFSANGTPLVAEKKIGPIDGASSWAPAVAVGVDDTVHIVQMDCKFQCNDLLYHKLANDGSDIWTNRVVSSDVGVGANTGTISASRWSGNFLFSFGSDAGTWLGRMDKFGVKDMASVRIRTQFDGNLVDVAETPNGTMVAAWSDLGTVYYTVVNATGVVKAAGRTVTSASNASAGVPRIAPFDDGRVAISWDDARDGNRQIYYAILTPTMIENGSQPENVRLTSSGGNATSPWIAIGPDGDLFVTWSDDRAGNPDIYYKRSVGCGMELYADPIELAGMYFLHPNQTYSLNLSLRNKGYQEDDYRIDLTASPSALAGGWGAQIDPTYVTALGAGNSTVLNMTVRAPPNARQGDSISLSINATSITNATCRDSIQMTLFVRVTRALELTALTSVKVGDNGETVAFAMVVKNTGDVYEDAIDVFAGGPFAPEGWNVSVDKPSVSLYPGEATNFTVFVTVPFDAPGNFAGIVGVVVTSSADPSVSAMKALTVQVKLNFFLRLSASPSSIGATPGSSLSFAIKVENVGNLPAQAQIDIGVSPAPPAGWTATLDRITVYLNGGENVTVHVLVAMPLNAVAGTRVNFNVTALAPRFGTTGFAALSVVVATACGFAAGVNGSSTATGTRPASFGIVASNIGNAHDDFTVEARLLPVGWSARFLQSESEITNFSLAPWTNSSLSVELTPPAGELAGTYGATIAFHGAVCGDFEIPLSATVEAVYSLAIRAVTDPGSAALGSTVVYELSLRNTGNAPFVVAVSVSGLAPGFGAVFVRLADDNVTEYTGTVGLGYSLAPGSQTRMRLYLSLPNATAVDRISFLAVAEVPGEASVAEALSLQILKPDIELTGAVTAPAGALAGRRVTVELGVHNGGLAKSPAASVRFFVDGTLVQSGTIGPLDPNATTQAFFEWVPAQGLHELRFVVELAGGFEEYNLNNNELVVSVGFDAPAKSPPSPASVDAYVWLSLAIVVAAGAAMGIVVGRKRKP